jgi:hypothetical protein
MEGKNMSYKATSSLIVFFLLLFVFNGCTNKEYSQFKTEFESKYFEIIDNVDMTNTLGSLKNMNTEENKKRIEELKVLLISIQSEIPKDRKEEYEAYQKWYEGLILLRDSYVQWNKLTIDIKGDIWHEIWLINRRKENSK